MKLRRLNLGLWIWSPKSGTLNLTLQTLSLSLATHTKWQSALWITLPYSLMIITDYLSLSCQVDWLGYGWQKLSNTESSLPRNETGNGRYSPQTGETTDTRIRLRIWWTMRTISAPQTKSVYDEVDNHGSISFIISHTSSVDRFTWPSGIAQCFHVRRISV